MQEIAPKYLVADFDKIQKKHEGLNPKDFIDDSLYKRCVSEVIPLILAFSSKDVSTIMYLDLFQAIDARVGLANRQKSFITLLQAM
jgi:hypothetical protein